MEISLEGRVALITGAAGEGIGRATAELMLESGATVALTDRGLARTPRVASELAEKYGDRVVGWPMDVGDRDRVDVVLAEIADRFGPIDILVNNAGINHLGDAHELSPQEWEQVMDINLNAPWYLTRALLPAMRERNSGVIVNVGSVAAYASDTLARGPYAASKAGLESLTRTVASENGSFGIRSVGVHPGVIATPWMNDRVDEVELKDSPSLGRNGTPQEVANVIVFLASDAASYVTGETVVVGGGFKMHN